MKNYKKKKGIVCNLILRWMETYCHGYRKAMTKDKILVKLTSSYNLDISERTLRRFLSVLRHEGHVTSLNSNPKGWWFIPLRTTDQDEIKAVLRSYEEKRSKALDMLEGISAQIREYEDRLAVSSGKQLEFSEV